MYVSVNKRTGLDVFYRDQDESVQNFTKAVLDYKEQVSASAEEFAQKVSVVGISMKDTAVLYGELHHRDCGGKVVLFKPRPGKPDSRITLRRKEGDAV